LGKTQEGELSSENTLELNLYMELHHNILVMMAQYCLESLSKISNSNTFIHIYLSYTEWYSNSFSTAMEVASSEQQINKCNLFSHDSIVNILQELKNFGIPQRRRGVKQVMVVGEYIVCDNGQLVLCRNWELFFNRKFYECDDSLQQLIRRLFPSVTHRDKVHTELMWLLGGSKLRSDRLYIIYSYYIPCAGNRHSITSCAEWLTKYAALRNINIIVGYDEVFEHSREDECFSIFEEGKVPLYDLTKRFIHGEEYTDVQLENAKLSRKHLELKMVINNLYDIIL